MSYNFEIAKAVLSENDKNRLMCLYLNCEPTAVSGSSNTQHTVCSTCTHDSQMGNLTQQQINWEKATRDFGAASVESMRVMTRSALKKIADAGGKEGVTGDPKKVAAAGNKRKGKADTDGGDDDEAATPKKKGKGGRKPKKDASPKASPEAGE